jgi:hypothetical protein
MFYKEFYAASIFFSMNISFLVSRCKKSFWHSGRKKERIYWAFGRLALNMLVQGCKTFLP